jgi:hypothetical protein
MALPQAFLRPLARVASWHASRQLSQFLAAHQRTQQAQDELLRELLTRHARTDFGRDHGFDKIRSYSDFASAVPLGDYDSFRPYMQRVLAGQTTALLPPGEPVLMFSQTSGTTGSPKFIPVTPRFLADIRRGWNIFGLRVLRDHPKSWLRPIVQISSSMRESSSPTGLPCGAISGLLAATQEKIVRRMYVVPMQVSEIRDAEARFYTILRCGIEKDIAFITTANPSSTIKMIETGQRHVERLLRDISDGTISPPGLPTGGELPPEVASHLPPFRPNRAMARRLEESVRRDGTLLPRHYWKLAFLTNWTGGTVGLYLARLRELFGDVPVRDIGLLASEGRFSVPFEDGTPSGVADILSNFLEFIPAGEYGRPNPSVRRAHELEVGAEYFLVLSNWAGLWRYSLDDRIRVTARFGHSPVFEFLSRGLHTANITGEKISEHQVVEAMRRACAQAGAGLLRFVLQGRFADTPYYELRMEKPDGLDLPALADRMDLALCEVNCEYQSKRKSARLGKIQPVTLIDGAMEQAERENIARHNGRSEQYKHQYLLTEVLPNR